MLNTLSKPRFILDHCRGKNVLDLGCVDAEPWQDRLSRERWLHARIRGVAQRVVGIDNRRDDIEEIRSRGFDVRAADLERLEDFELEYVDDVIVAGDVIEHLSNPGLFLDGVARFFGPSTVMLITVPNAFYFPRFIDALRRRELVREDHTCWYSHATLNQLLRRHGYQIVQDSLSFLLEIGFHSRRTLFEGLALILSRRLSQNLYVIASRPGP